MNLTIRKVGPEWCAFHPSGREVARSRTKEWLDSYVADLGKDTTPSRPARKPPTTHQETAMPAIPKLSYRTRARSTGAAMATGRTEDKKWHALCLSHGYSIPADSGSAAEKQLQQAPEWCPECSLIDMGAKPKVAKNAELDELL